MRKFIVFASTGLAAALLAAILLLCAAGYKNTLPSQNAASRWGDGAQVTVFVSPEAGVDLNTVYSFRENVDAALVEKSISTENENARLWLDGYSAQTTGSITSEYGSASVNIVSVGGDFFFFHPYDILSGYYFSDNDLNADRIVIDEETSWQLFGSKDTAGMETQIGAKTYIVAAVIKRDTDKASKATYDERPYVFIPASEDTVITCYEAVLPNPISNFALDIVEKAALASENYTEYVENSSRFSFVSRLKLFAGLSKLSLRTKPITYPYFENAARINETKSSLMTIPALIILLYPLTLAIIGIIYAWRHKKWDKQYLIDRKDDLVDRYNAWYLKRKSKNKA